MAASPTNLGNRTHVAFAGILISPPLRFRFAFAEGAPS